MIASHFSGGNSSIGATCWMPALLTRMSTAPNAGDRASDHRGDLVGLAPCRRRSRRTSTPCSAASRDRVASIAPASPKPLSTTLAPAAASALAMPRPMPTGRAGDEGGLAGCHGRLRWMSGEAGARSARRSARSDRTEHARPARAGHGRQVARPAGERLAREPRERQRLDVLDGDAAAPRSWRPCAARARVASAAISAEFFAPPPQTSTSVAPAAVARIASAIVRAVSATSVACTSSAPRRALARAGELRLEPRGVEQVAAGALRRRQREVRLGEQHREQRRVDAARARPRAVASNVVAAMARAPQVRSARCRARCRSRARPPRRRAPAESVMLAMPPMLTTTRCASAAPNSAAWNAGTSGAPCPPAATSRLRKSATTVMPARSATRAALLSCSVQPCVGAVAHRLAVHARGDDVGGGHAGAPRAPRRSRRRRRRPARWRRAPRARARRRPLPAAPAARRAARSAKGRWAAASTRQRGRRRREIGDDGVDAVEAGAGHHAGVELAAHRRAMGSGGAGYSAAASERAGERPRRARAARRRLDPRGEGRPRSPATAARRSAARPSAGCAARRRRGTRSAGAAPSPSRSGRRSRSRRPAPRARRAHAAARTATGARRPSRTRPECCSWTTLP